MVTGPLTLLTWFSLKALIKGGRSPAFVALVNMTGAVLLLKWMTMALPLSGRCVVSRVHPVRHVRLHPALQKQLQGARRRR